MNNVITTLSDEEMTNIKVVDLDELYNFLYITFLVETIWGFKIMFQVIFFKKI
jgi:hypothetical protein